MRNLLHDFGEWMGYVWLWLKAGIKTRGSVEAAAAALYLLNGHVHRKRQARQDVYRIKDKMIQALLDDGYCAEVEIQEQILNCYGDNGKECNDDCPRCGGTSIYKRSQLYRFVFVIGDKAYSWHKPASQINPPIPEGVRFAYDRNLIVALPALKIPIPAQAHLTYVCWWYLWSRGRQPALRLALPFRFIRTSTDGVIGRYLAGVCYARNENKMVVRWPSVPSWRPRRESDWINYDWVMLSRQHERWTVCLFGKAFRWRA